MPDIKTEEERRYLKCPLELRQEGDGPLRIEMFIPYDVETDVFWFREVIRPGFFARALTEDQDVVAWYQHGEGGRLPLGRVSSGNLTLTESPAGLRAIATPPERPWVADLVESVRRGDVNGASFAFSPTRERWTEEEGKPPLRELLDGEIWDVSPVVFPAYPSTFTDLRNQAERVLLRHRNAHTPEGRNGLEDITNPGIGGTGAPEPNQSGDPDVALYRLRAEGEYLAALHGLEGSR
jgi:HK97 family phage prohead protease